MKGKWWFVCLSYYDNIINKLSLKLKLSQRNMKQKLHVIQVLLKLEAIYNQYRQYGSKYKPSWLSYKHLSKLACILELSILSFPWITSTTALEWSKIIKILVSIKKIYLLSRTENWLFVTDGKNFGLKFWNCFFELK